MPVRIGYGRVSTRDQNPDGQHDALVAAGCEEILVDMANGKLARRPALDQALLVARAGNQLVVTKLDRLGRSLEHLIALAEDLQAREIDLVVLDQGIDTSTAVGRMFFQRRGRAHPLRAVRAAGVARRASPPRDLGGRSQTLARPRGLPAG